MDHTQTNWWQAESVNTNWSSDAALPVEQWEPPHTAIPFWSTMVLIAVVVFAPQAYFPSLEAIRPAMIPAVIGIGAYVLDRFAAKAPLFMSVRELRLVGALLAWATITIPLSLWPGGSVEFLTGYYLKTLAVFWLLSHSTATLFRLRQTIWILSIMAVGLGMFAFDNYLSGLVVDKDRVFGNEGALTKNPNDLALMVNIIVPLTMALLLSNRRPIIRATLFGMLILEGLTVVSTYSRTGFLTLGAIVLAYAWKLRRSAERVWILAVLCVALLSLPLLPSSYVERMTTIVHTEEDVTGSANERWRDMMAAVRYVLSSPVKGAGVGMNVFAMNEARGGGSLRVHNVFLELTMDLGIPGVLLFSWWLWICLKNTSRVSQEAAEKPELQELGYLAQGIHISLLAFTVAAMFQPVSYHPYFYYLAALALAAQAVFHSVTRASREHSLVSPSPS